MLIYVTRRILILFFLTIFIINTSSIAYAHKNLSVYEQLSYIEEKSGGRLGLSLLDRFGNQIICYKGDDRFPFASTFKVILVAAILKQSELDPTLLHKKVFYVEEDIVSWSPITEKNLKNGMTIFDLCVATLQHGDNTAANLLIKELGTPKDITAFARFIGDDVFSLDRWEPDLNSSEPNDIRDTTSPLSMAKTLQKIIFSDVLQKDNRTQLQEWLMGNETGEQSIKAGLPKGWFIGDKTGSGFYGTTNDIAIIYSPLGHIYVITIYFTQEDKYAPLRKDILAKATSIVIKELTKAGTSRF